MNKKAKSVLAIVILVLVLFFISYFTFNFFVNADPPTNVTVVKSPVFNPVNCSSIITFTINVTNNNSFPIINVLVNDTGPLGESIFYSPGQSIPVEYNWSAGAYVAWLINVSPHNNSLMVVNFTTGELAGNYTNHINVTNLSSGVQLAVTAVNYSIGNNCSGGGEFPYAVLDSLAYDGNPLPYANVSGRMMLFAGETVDIKGDANDSDFANWTISLENSSGMVNSSLCFGTSPVGGTFCSWNTSSYCLGECENYTLVLNATDTLGHTNSTFLGNITIDNSPPSIGQINTTTIPGNPPSWVGEVNISDTYLQKVDGFIFDENNSLVVETDYLCNKTEGNNCTFPGNGEFNYSWYWENYFLNGVKVPAIQGEFFTDYTNDYLAVVPGCFAQDGTNYDCGGLCADQEVCSEYKWALVYNMTPTTEDRTFLGLTNAQLCSQEGCLVNTTIIQNGTSKFKPQSETLDFFTIEWSYENVTEITLYDVNDSYNLNLSFETPEPGNYSLAFIAYDSFWTSLNYVPDYINLSGGGGMGELNAELNDFADNGFVMGIVNITGYVNGTDLANWTVSISNSSGMVNSSLCFGDYSVNGSLCLWYTSQYCLGECANYTVMLNATGLEGNASSWRDNLVIDNHAPNISILLINTSDSSVVFARANITDNYLHEVHAYVFNYTNKTIMEWGRFCGESQGDACDEILQGTFNRSWGKRIYQLDNNTDYILSVSNKWSFNGTDGTILVPGCFAQDGNNYDCGGNCSNQSVCHTYRWWLAYNESQQSNESLVGISNDQLCSDGCQLNNSAIINGTSKFRIQTDRYNFSSGEWSYENLTSITLYSIGNSSGNLNVTSSNIDEGNFSFAFEAEDQIGWGSLSAGNFNLTPSQQENTNFSLSNTMLNSQRLNVGDTIRFLINVTNTGTSNISNLTITNGFDVDYNYTNASVTPSSINYTAYVVSWNNLSVNLSQNQSYLLYTNFSAIFTTHHSFNVVNLTVYYASGSSSTTSSSFDFEIGENVTPNIVFIDATTSGEGNYSRSSIWANISVNDSSEISNVTIFLFNSTGLYNSSTNNSIGGPSGYFFVNFTNLPEGTYRLNATVNDTWGNPNSTGTKIITLDRTLPYVAWISPASTNYTNSSIIIDITNGSDASSVWWDNETVNITYTTAIVYNFSQGSHTVIAYANDSAGNINFSSRTFFVDSITPAIDFGSGTETSGTTITQDNIVINATASDSGSGLKNLTTYFYNSSGLISNNTASSSPLFLNISLLGDGIYYFNATAYDNLGNFNYTETRNVTISAVPPMITIITPLNQTYASTIIIFNISLSEQGGWCGLSLDNAANSSMTFVGNFANYTNSSMTQGSHGVIFYCNDTSGNINLTSARYFFIDSIAPAFSNNITSPASPANYSLSQSYQFNITLNETNSLDKAVLIFNGSNYTMNHSGSNYTYTISSLAVGNYTYSFWANDSAGNSNYTSDKVYTVNKINPVITALLNGAANNLTIAYPNQVNASGSTTGGTLIMYLNDTQINNSLNYTFGSNYYRFDFNVTGNENYSSSSVSLFANITRANSTVALYLNNSQGNISHLELENSIWINVTSTPQGNTLLYKNATLVNNGTSPLANYTLFNSVGLYNITAIYPATQNYSSSSETWWISVNDTTGPTITLPLYTNATIKKNTDTLTLNISVTDAGTSQSPCFIDVNTTNQTITYSNGWCNGTVALTGLTDGNQTIKVYANDSSGNMGINNNYFVWLDTTGPTITLPVYTNATKYTSSQSMIFNIYVADSGVGGSYCRINVGGQTNQTAAVSAGWCNGTYNLSGITDGNKTIYAYANDTLGNFGLNSNYVVGIDSTSPIASQGTNPVDYYNSTSSSITFDMKCSDNAAVSSIQLWGNWAGNWTVNYSNSSYINNTWLNIAVTGIPEGNNYKWAVYCNDTIGSTNVTNNRTFRVDTTAPHITVFSPGNTTYYTVQNITVNFTATDSTNVDSLWYDNTTSNVSSNNGTYTLTNGSYTFIFWANDSFNNLANKSITFTVQELADNQSILNDSNVTIEENTTEVILPQNQTLTIIIIPSNRTETEPIILNLGQITDSDGNTSFGTDVNLSRIGGSDNYILAIPSNVVIIGGSNWTGEFVLPTVKSNSGLTAPGISGYTTTLVKVISLGSGGLNFSSPVKIIIGGMNGKKAGWSNSNSFNDISTVCDNITNPTLNLSVRECYDSTGDDLIIWTLHSTDFAAYTSTAIEENPSHGGGGGGGGTVENETNETAGTVSQNATNLGSLDKKGKEVRVSVNGTIQFTINGKSSILTVLEAYSNKIKISIFPLGSQPVLNLNEPKKIDLNGDGINELEITFKGLFNGEADIFVRALSTEVKDITCAEGYKRAGDKCVKTGIPVPITPIWPIIIVVAIVGALLVYIMVIVKKKTKD